MPRGGARPGAGRKPKPKPESAAPAAGFTDPAGKRKAGAPAGWPFGEAQPAQKPDAKDQDAHAFLKSVYSDVAEDMRVRIQAAVAALPYEAAKLAPKGKAGGKETDKPAGPSKFGAMAAPKLVHSRT